MILVSSLVLGISTCVSLPFVVLPMSFAIPIALSIIFFSADLVINAKRYSEEIPAKWIKAKTFIKESFTPRPDETPHAATIRIARNIAIATVGAAAIITVAFALQHMIAGALAAKAAGSFSIWELQNFLPGQTVFMVFLEYGILGLAHGALAIKKFKEGKNIEALFHLVNCILGFYFPTYYFLHSTLGSPMRIHHSFLGLLISLAPFKTLKVYGALTTVDSFAYAFFLHRGHWEYNRRLDFWRWSSSDFQNLVLDHPALYSGVFGTTTAAEFASSRRFK